VDRPAGHDTNTLRLIVGHELRNLLSTHSGAMGQGGAFTVITAKRLPGGKWGLAEDTARAVDFAPVGWTANNCGGAVLPNGRIISGEEVFDYFDTPLAVNPPGKPQRFEFTNAEAGYRDSFYTIPASVPQFGGRRLPLHHNFGWMVEFDPNTLVATRKLYALGRFSHESAAALPDGRTLILTDDFTPAVLFKFVADSGSNYATGQLYAFRQDTANSAGEWVPLPRDLDSLIDARNVAIRRGATLFARLEWAAYNPRTGEVYITETGCDSVNLTPYCTNPFAGKPARHWVEMGAWQAGSNVLHHPYGSVLALSNAGGQTSSVRPLLNGGNATQNAFNFASPDGLAFIRTGSERQGYREWLIIQEDLNGPRFGRQPNPATPDSLLHCEGFLLDLSIANPTVDDLHRIFRGAPGAELAGAALDPQGRDLLLNHQHPTPGASAAPYNTDAVWVLPGLGAELNNLPGTTTTHNGLLGYRAAPILGGVFFTRPVDAQVVDDRTSQTVARTTGRDFVRLSYLPRGNYTVRVGSESLRVVVE
jgi:secreted PhoX family phosphatase